MTRIQQMDSPFCNAEKRKEMGLVTLSEMAAIVGEDRRKIAKLVEYASFPKPKKVSPKGAKRLWCAKEAQAFIGKIDFSSMDAGAGNAFNNAMAVNFHALKPPKKPVKSLRELAEKHDRKPKFDKRHLGTVRVKSDWM